MDRCICRLVRCPQQTIQAIQATATLTSENKKLVTCCSPRASPYRVALHIAISYEILDHGHEPGWYRDPGQWCRQPSTNIWTGTDGRQPEMPRLAPRKPDVQTLFNVIRVHIYCTFYACSAVLITTMTNRVG